MQPSINAIETQMVCVCLWPFERFPLKKVALGPSSCLQSVGWVFLCWCLWQFTLYKLVFTHHMKRHTNASLPSKAVFVFSSLLICSSSQALTHKCLCLSSSLGAITSDHAQISPPRLINICRAWFSTWIPSYLTMACVKREFLCEIT